MEKDKELPPRCVFSSTSFTFLVVLITRSTRAMVPSGTYLVTHKSAGYDAHDSEWLALQALTVVSCPHGAFCMCLPRGAVACSDSGAFGRRSSLPGGAQAPSPGK